MVGYVISRVESGRPGVGDVVFLERPVDAKGTDGKPLSNYDSGEFVVLAMGANTIEVCRMGDVYAMHNTSRRNLIGSDAWEITAITRSPELLVELLQSVEDTIARIRTGQDKPVWVMSVYDNAAANCCKIRNGLVSRGTPLPPPKPQPVVAKSPVPTKGVSVFVDGIQVVVPLGAKLSWSMTGGAN